MDPIELANALPPRQRRALYFKAMLRLAIPAMPWPAWIALCGAASTGAMCAAWILLAPSLPELGAARCMEAVALMLPALAIDGLLRKIPGVGRSRLAYMAAPLLSCAALAAWLSLSAQPLAQAEARAAGARARQAAAQSLLADAEASLAGADPQAMLRAAEGLRLGLAASKKPEPAAPKAAALPPIPLPPGVPNPSLPAPAPREADAEGIESAATQALGMIGQQGALYSASASRIASAAASLRAAAREPAAAASPKQAEMAFEAFEAASLAAWIGSPLLALILCFGVANSAAAPFRAAWALLALAGRGCARLARPAIAKLIAPGPAELAELHRRVEAYREMQAEFDARPFAEPQAAAAPILSPEFSDLDISFDFHPRTAASANEEPNPLAKSPLAA